MTTYQKYIDIKLVLEFFGPQLNSCPAGPCSLGMFQGRLQSTFWLLQVLLKSLFSKRVTVTGFRNQCVVKPFGKLSLLNLNGIVLLMLLKLLMGIKAEGLEFRSL